MKIRFEVFLVGAVALTASCGMRRSLRDSNSVASSSKPSQGQKAAEEAALMSVLQDVQNKKADYKISGADLLDVSIYQQQDLDRKVRVSQNGTISFPLIGIVEVGGLSVTEAEEAISLAGGFIPIAAPDRTKVIRTVEGKSQILTVEVSAITKRGEKQKDIFLEPSDVVYIPQSFF